MKKKRQHFIPQHYLRQFRIGSTSQIATSLVNPYKFIGPAAINRQCQESYFYGVDGQLDDYVTKCEMDLAPVLYNVLRKKCYDAQELVALCMLAVLLHIRTRKAVEKAKLFPKLWASEMIEAGIKSGRLPSPKGGWTRNMIDFDGVAAELFRTSLIPNWLEMQTLCCKLLETPDSNPFITCDDPVVMLNQYAADAGTYRAFVGFAQSGFQLLMPLSPNLCAIFYDGGVYKVGKRRDILVQLTDSDVTIINALQVQAAEHCLYFNSPSLENRVDALVKRFQHLRTPISDLLRSYPGRNEKEEFLHARAESVKLPSAWSFCKYKRHINRSVGERRNPAWSEMVIRLEDDNRVNPKPEDLFDRIRRVIAAQYGAD